MAYQTIPPGSGSDAWVSSQTAFLKSKVAQLTRFDAYHTGQFPGSVIAATAFAGSVTREGGALTPLGAGTLYHTTGGVLATLKTGYWGLVWRGTMLPPVAARNSNVGLFNTGSTHGVYARTAHATDATKIILEIIGGATTDVISTFTADAAVHNFALTGDTVTVGFHVDGVTYASTTTLTNVVDELCGVFSNASVITDVTTSRVLIGYVDP